MSTVGVKILIRVALTVLGLALGLALGYGYGYTRGEAFAESGVSDHRESSTSHSGQARNEDDHAHDDHAHAHAGHAHGHHAPDDDHGDEDVLIVSPEAVANLGLRTGPAEISDHFRERLIPGRVSENPGKSHISITAPTGGVVSKVLISRGQSIRPDTPLFQLRVTDEELTTAQLKLLEIVSRKKVIKRELARLKPLSDIVLGKRQRELEYECDTLTAEENSRIQELALRGLDKKQIQEILDTAEMIREITVPARQARDSDENSSEFTLVVDDLLVSPGTAVARGDLLCDLANHNRLQIEGQAFEADLESLLRLKSKDWRITAEFGHNQHGDHAHSYAETGLKISHLNSRVDPADQTFLFYIDLDNTIIDETVNDAGEKYQTWKFVPGQKVHLRIPVEKWTEQFKVPLAAIVQDGAEWFVYRQHVHGTPDPEDSIELEPIEVRVLYRDDRFAILSPHGKLRPRQPIALNNAYQLHQAMKMKSSGGGAAHHGHSH